MSKYVLSIALLCCVSLQTNAVKADALDGVGAALLAGAAESGDASDESSSEESDGDEGDRVCAIQVDFQGDRTLTQLVALLHTAADFDALDRDTQEGILALHPAFRTFLEKSDAVGQQVEVGYEDYALIGATGTAILRTPIKKSEMPAELGELPYVTCTALAEVPNNADEVKRVLAAAQEEKRKKDRLSASRVARCKRWLRNRLR